LTQLLITNDFKICPEDECVLNKKFDNGEDIVLILYVYGIMIMSKNVEDRQWVKAIIGHCFDKVTSDEGDRLTYLGMTIIKNKEGFEVCMKLYVHDILKLYGKDVKTCSAPAGLNLFVVNGSERIQEVAKCHSIVAKL
jgi:hypothetical protein